MLNPPPPFRGPVPCPLPPALGGFLAFNQRPSWLFPPACPTCKNLPHKPPRNRANLPSRMTTRPCPLGEAGQAGVPGNSHHPGGDAVQSGARRGGGEGQLGMFVRYSRVLRILLYAGGTERAPHSRTLFFRASLRFVASSLEI